MGVEGSLVQRRRRDHVLPVLRARMCGLALGNPCPQLFSYRVVNMSQRSVASVRAGPLTLNGASGWNPQSISSPIMLCLVVIVDRVSSRCHCISPCHYPVVQDLQGVISKAPDSRKTKQCSEGTSSIKGPGYNELHELIPCLNS